MIQRQERHPAGTFLNCNQCGREPTHIVEKGKKSTDSVSFGAEASERHHLECCRCGRQTLRAENFTDAVADWGQKFAQHDLPLRFPKRRAA